MELMMMRCRFEFHNSTLIAFSSSMVGRRSFSVFFVNLFDFRAHTHTSSHTLSSHTHNMRHHTTYFCTSWERCCVVVVPQVSLVVHICSLMKMTKSLLFIILFSSFRLFLPCLLLQLFFYNCLLKQNKKFLYHLNTTEQTVAVHWKHQTLQQIVLYFL